MGRGGWRGHDPGSEMEKENSCGSLDGGAGVLGVGAAVHEGGEQEVREPGAQQPREQEMAPEDAAEHLHQDPRGHGPRPDPIARDLKRGS